MPSDHAVGVFDSGLGGLSVLRAIRERLPNEHLFYVADTAHLPYGEKTADFLQQRARQLSSFLLEQGAKAIVIACNTATAAAASSLRTDLKVPVIAMEPAVKPASEATKTGVVGVLATTGTLESAQFAALLARFGQGVRVLTQPCPGLPERVEAGDLEGPETQALLERYVTPLVGAGADVIVLGCTHYVFLKPALRVLLGPQVHLIETGAAVARRLEHVLVERDLNNTSKVAGRERIWTSGNVSDVLGAVATLWPRAVPVKAFQEPERPE